MTSFNEEAGFGFERPLLVTTVDAEETFDWSKPFSREFRDVAAMAHQHLAHDIFERYGVVPTYFVTYPVAIDNEASRYLSKLAAHGKCTIGAQLHSWVTPPFSETLSPQNSFEGNLPESLELSKLEALTRAIAEQYGGQPKYFRAGRYGIGPNSARLLASFGYQIDSSVVPEQTYLHEGGPEFLGYSPSPYWLNSARTLLELPLTSGYVGQFARSAQGFASALFTKPGYSLARAVMARTRLLERIRLTPEGTSVSEAKRLVRTFLGRGIGVFTLTYHAPSLVPGCTPYVKSIADRDALLNWLECFYHYFFVELGGRPTTASEVYDLARRNAEGKPKV